MGTCEVCGNRYEKTFEIIQDGKTHVFDSFECAIHALAPECGVCNSKIIGHGVEANKTVFCCANCARDAGYSELRDHA